MNTLSASLNNLELGLPNIALSRTSLSIKEGANEDDYQRLEQWLTTVGGSMQWWSGDYLNHLASARGVEYAEAKCASSYDAVTLKKAAWVCRHVDPSRRHEGLSFGHHQEVAALSPTDQEIWLDRAEDEGWSVRELRAEIRMSKAEVTNGADQGPVDQRAARASQGFEVFSAWYQTAAPSFTPAQRQEWDESLEPLVEEWLKRNRGHAMLRLKELARD